MTNTLVQITKAQPRAAAVRAPARKAARDQSHSEANRPTKLEAPSAEAQDEAITFEIGSGNVFADIGLPEPEDEALKARIVMRLRAEMDRRKLTQGEVAAIIGAKQPDVSKLVRGQVLGFSLERMLEFMRALGDDVEITLRPSRGERRGRMSLKVA